MGSSGICKRSHWFELVGQVRRGERIATDLAGSVVWVQDVADALALAVGETSVAGQFYNLADTYLTWQSVAEMAKALGGSAAVVEQVSTPPAGPVFDTRKAVDFFDRHGNTIALRRGTEGVRVYLGELMEPSSVSFRRHRRLSQPLPRNRRIRTGAQLPVPGGVHGKPWTANLRFCYSHGPATVEKQGGR